MTDLTQADYERVAREFLHAEPRGQMGLFFWRGADGNERHVMPGPNGSFFFACWEECKRRGWLWAGHNMPGVVDVGEGWTLVPSSRDSVIDGGRHMEPMESDHGDPRVDLPACILQWLDAQEV